MASTQISIRFLFILSLVCSGCSTLRGGTQSSQTFQAWTELGPDTSVIVRAVTSGSKCPALLADGVPAPMNVRSDVGKNFQVISCEAIFSTDIASLKIQSPNGLITLPILSATVKKIVVFGDTGCRIKILPADAKHPQEFREIQDCNDPSDWPFLKIAKAASEFKPDLVIHVGDYLYRESPCPIDPVTGGVLKKCAGSPSGYGWDVWNADFFKPSSQLLGLAPWIFVRGNHELCSRAGEGWFRYLDPRPYSPSCSDRTDFYSIKLGNLKLAVLDSSNADDLSATDEAVNYYVNQFGLIEDGGRGQWILTHRPFWAIFAGKDGTGTMNKTLQKSAVQSEFEMQYSPIDLVLAGHIHLFEALNFKDGGPSQLVLGNGGTELNLELPKAEKPHYKDIPVGDRKVKAATLLKGFGFLTLQLEANGNWDAIARDQEGKPIARFQIRGNQIEQVR